MPAPERVPALSGDTDAVLEDDDGGDGLPDDGAFDDGDALDDDEGDEGEGLEAVDAPEADPVLSAALAADPVRALTLLQHGALHIHGQLTQASNAVFYCTVERDGDSAVCVYKPVRGERPLWDFPDGTLAGRETAAYQVAAALGWGLVPPTVFREDGPLGPGMCQIWVEADPDAELLSLQDAEEPSPGWRAVGRAEVGGGRTALLVHADDERLRRLAVLDAVINNGDRKGGHLLPAVDGRLYGIDHGVTFSTDPKLRTLLWGWAGEPLPPDADAALGGLLRLLDGDGDGGGDGGGGGDSGGPLGVALAPLLTAAEIAALRDRAVALRASGVHPEPSGDWPAVPWPPI